MQLKGGGIMATNKSKLIIPLYDPYNPQPYPGSYLRISVFGLNSTVTKIDELEYVTFSRCDIRNNSDLAAKTMSTKAQLINAFETEGPQTIEELTRVLKRPTATIRAELSRNNELFVKAKDGEKWGLITKV
jgi:hypothetical protein